MPSVKKQLQVEELTKLITENPNFAVIKFEKTPHTTLERLRTELKKSEAGFKVLKNALFDKTLEKLSAKNKGIEKLREKTSPLRDNSALLSLKGDFVAALGAFHKFTKTESSLSFKIGYLEDQVYEAEKLNKLAQLPPKPVLLARILGSLKSPQTRVVYSLKYNISQLSYILRERGKQTQ